jgi:peptide/nickel transport system substrate-binding protein
MKRLVATIAAAALLAGCSKVASENAGGEHSWTQPGVLRVAIQSEPLNLDTLLASNTTDNMVDRLIFDPLISATPAGEPVPILVTEVPTLENGGIGKDGLTITYHLRPGITFSDGVPLTSKDVKFSWQQMMNPNNNVVSRHGYDEVQSIDTPNAATVIVHLKERFAPFVNTFFAEGDSPVGIVPEHVLAKYPNVNKIAFNLHPIGSGPFEVQTWSKGDHITLIPNPHYFLGTPKLKRIVIRVVPDENTSVNLLHTHDIDWMFEPSYGIYPQISHISGVTVHYNNINGYESIYLNTSHWPLTDPKFRLAMVYAIDKKNLLDVLTYGQEKIATEDLPDWLWAYNRDVTTYAFDAAKAKQILASDGFTPGANGILQKDGKSVNLLIVTNTSNATRRKGVQVLQEMLHQVGIGSQIKTYDGALLFAPAGMGGILQKGMFDIGWAGWFAGIDPDDSSQFLSKNIPPGGYNYTRLRSPQMDAAQKLALESYDRPTRKKAYAVIEELLARENPQIFFWWDRQAQAVSVDFKGFDPNPVTESWNAYQWSI